MTTKTKIVLDADVIIHFIKAERFNLLLDIFPEYEYLILDVVYCDIKSWNTPYTSECKTDNFLFTGPSLFCKSIFQLQICNSLLPLYTLFFLKTFVFPDFLSFLCHINSILKKDCLNYREELRDWAR